MVWLAMEGGMGVQWRRLFKIYYELNREEDEKSCNLDIEEVGKQKKSQLRKL